MPPADADRDMSPLAQDRAVEPQGLLDSIGDQRPVLDHRVPLVLVCEQVAQHAAHRVRGGVVTGEGHRVHDVHDVVDRHLLRTLVVVAEDVAGEVVAAIRVAVGDVVLDVVPERDDVLRNLHLVVRRQVPVGEEHPPTRPRLDLVEVLDRDAEEPEAGATGKRVREVGDEIGHGLLDQRSHEAGRVLAQLGLERREPGARHAREHGFRIGP